MLQQHFMQDAVFLIFSRAETFFSNFFVVTLRPLLEKAKILSTFVPDP